MRHKAFAFSAEQKKINQELQINVIPDNFFLADFFPLDVSVYAFGERNRLLHLNSKAFFYI